MPKWADMTPEEREARIAAMKAGRGKRRIKQRTIPSQRAMRNANPVPSGTDPLQEDRPFWAPPDDPDMPGPADDGVTIIDGGPSLEEIRDDRRARLTGDLPADLAALITDEELEKIEREETDKAIASKKKQALSEIRALASAEARIEHGLIPADVLRSEAEKARLAQKRKIKVNLPRGGGALGLRIDGRLFRHGQTYEVTTAEFESMHYTVYKTWLDEIRFRTLDQNERGRSAIDQITANPPQFEVVG
jgi:hypothetical protein